MTHINSHETLTNRRISKTQPEDQTLQKSTKKKKRPFAKLSTLFFMLTTEWNWKNMKRRINTSTLLGNWKKKTTVEHDGDNYTNCYWCFWYTNLRIIKRPGGLGSWWTSRDHPNDNIIENDQNTEKSPGDLRRHAVTQTPVKDIQLTPMCKTLKEITIIILRSVRILGRVPATWRKSDTRERQAVKTYKKDL